MSVGYTSIQWNPHKKLYDLTILAGVLLAVGGLTAVSLLLHPRVTAETLILRSTAVAGFLLLNVILAIGPLARLDRRFLPLLYNRRHLGVTMFLLGLVHGTVALVQFHALGDTNPAVSVLTAYSSDYALFRDGAWNLAHFPFEVFGVVALLILFLMAATSHDFWLRNLGASWWKGLHLLVLVAYASLVLHVTLGALQSETSLLYPVLLIGGAVVVLGLHLAAAWKEAKLDRRRTGLERQGFERACRAAELAEGRGKVVQVGGQRLAVFRHQGKLYGLSNVCRHQGGPLGEGKIIDGCVTCPWHGWQYRPDDGKSPPPFTEVVPTYPLELVGEDIYIQPTPRPLGEQAPGVLAPLTVGVDHEDFYVGYLPMPQSLSGFVRKAAFGLLALVAVLPAVVAWQQNSFDSGTFEFGVTRSFEGVLYERPLPMLHVVSGTGSSNLLLAGAGKLGAPEVIRGHHGQWVSFDGSLIYRRGLTMIEMNAPDTFRADRATRPEERLGAMEPVGKVELEGEIVDTKCFLGVMRPGAGKVHRACAVRCLSGGVPPGLLVRTEEDPAGTVYLLAGSGGKPLDLDVEWAGRVARVSGDLSVLGEVPLLEVTEITLSTR
ncbi:MAG: ferric reductase-like transmembrane domain-containing protein [Acidobacteria bacterium]|nr:ferric reductase-like transmembrane domain-containing protein [Acidobacteriota bacterium]